MSELNVPNSIANSAIKNAKCTSTQNVTKPVETYEKHLREHVRPTTSKKGSQSGQRNGKPLSETATDNQTNRENTLKTASVVDNN